MNRITFSKFMLQIVASKRRSTCAGGIDVPEDCAEINKTVTEENREHRCGHLHAPICERFVRCQKESKRVERERHGLRSSRE